MNKFDSVINEKLKQLGETLTTADQQKAVDNLNALIKTTEPSQRQPLLDLLGGGMKNLGGKLALAQYASTGPSTGTSGAVGTGAAGTSAAGTSAAGTSGATGSGAGSTGSTETTSTGSTPQQTLQQMLQAQKASQATSQGQAVQSDMYNKLTGYAKG